MAQQPNFVVVPDNVTTIQPEIQEDDIFDLRLFQTLGTPFGTALDQVAEAIMFCVKRVTSTARWIGAIDVETNGSTHVDDGKKKDANFLLAAMKKGFNRMTNMLYQTFLDALSWLFFSVIAVVLLMWILGTIKTIICDGPRSSVTARVAWALPLLILDVLAYFAQLFNLIQPRPRGDNPNARLEQRWSALLNN